MDSTMWSNFTTEVVNLTSEVVNLTTEVVNLTSTIVSVVSTKTTPATTESTPAAEFELILPFIFGILVILSLSLLVFYYKPEEEESYQLPDKQEPPTQEKDANLHGTDDWEMSAIFGSYK